MTPLSYITVIIALYCVASTRAFPFNASLLENTAVTFYMCTDVYWEGTCMNMVGHPGICCSQSLTFTTTIC